MRCRPLYTAACVLFLLTGSVLVVPAVAGGQDDADLSRWVKKGPRPPDRVEERVELPFPPPARARPAPAPSRPDAIPLRVVRHQPDGVEQEAHAISVTFNQPMVAVTSLDQVESRVPLRIQPPVPGTFRWLGGRTVSFEPKGRIPFATAFTVTVPAGTRAASGQELEEEFRFTFATPRPRVLQFSPSDRQREVGFDPVLVLTFNQAVETRKVARFVHLIRDDGEPVPLRAVPRARWKSDRRVAGYAGGGSEQRRVIFTLQRKLALGHTYRLEVRAGLTSAEGPLPVEKPQTASFSTTSPLQVTGLHCRSDELGWNDKRCEPQGAVDLSFNHALRVKEPGRFFSVRPRVPGLEMKVSYGSVKFSGGFQAGKAYTFSVKPGVQDEHGQRLRRGWSGRMQFVHLPPRMEIGAPEGPVVLGLNSNLELPVWLRNLRKLEVQVFRVDDGAIQDMINLAGRATYDSFAGDLKKIEKNRVAGFGRRLHSAPDRFEVHGISLRQVVRRHGPGPYLLVLRAPGLKDDPHRARLVLATDIGLLARYDSRKMAVAAHSIRSGKPLAGVEVRLGEAAGSGERARTNSDGLALLKAEKRKHGLYNFALLARKGKDRSFVILDGSGDDQSWAGLSWGQSRQAAFARTFLWADRDLYRPGETVHVFGASRRFEADQTGRPGPMPKGYDRVRWTAVSSRGRKLGEGKVPISRWGRFGFELALPADVALGRVRIEAAFASDPEKIGGNGALYVDVQEYRAPEFKVDVQLQGSPFLRGGELRGVIQADYLHGAPMSGADASWNLYSREARFAPPGNQGFHFGELVRPWRHEHRVRWRHPFELRNQVIGGSGKLSAKGQLEVRTGLEIPSGRDPVSLSLEATVTGKNRQAVSGRAAALAHPADRYLGIRTGRLLASSTEPLRVESVLVDLDGKRIAGTPIRLTATRTQWTEKQVRDAEGNLRSDWTSATVTEDGCEVQSAERPVACVLDLRHGGVYTLTASAVDGRDRPISTQAWLMVMGPGRLRPGKQAEAGRIQLLPDRTIYEAGQTATVMLHCPFERGFALVSWSRQGLLGERVVAISGYTASLEIPVGEDLVPGFHVGAAAVKARGGGSKRSPAAWAFGRKRIPVSTGVKRLDVGLQPASRFARPGQKVPVEITLKDVSGKPVAGRIAVVAVDEAVLSMTAFATPDPLPFFYFPRPADTVLKATLRRLLAEWTEPARGAKAPSAKRRLGMSPKAAEMAAAAGPGAGAGAKSAVRRLFQTTPLVAEVESGAAGRARVELALPDNLTTFRIMAVAVDEAERFGSGEARVTVRKPLMLRPALPRFVNYKDAFDAAVLIDDRGGTGGVAKVRLEVEGIRCQDPQVKAVALSPGRTAEVAFRVRADRVGPVRFVFFVDKGGETDAVEKSLVVWTPATAEAFATYGMLPRTLQASRKVQASMAQPVAPPENALEHFGALELSLSATALTGLKDAVRHLVEYPYACVEQTASRALPVFVLGDVLDQFGLADLGTKERRNRLARRALQRLVDRQCPDGGWSSYSCSYPSWPHLSAYVLFVLQEGRAAGFDVPRHTVQRARRFLETWLASEAKGEHDRDWWWRYRLDTAALSLYALTRDGKHRYPEHTARLYRERAELDLFAWAMLAAVFHRQEPGGGQVRLLMRELENRVVETPAGVHFAERRSEALRMLMHSSARTDAIAMMVWLEVDPEADLVPKLARALMDGRIRGHWETTQADAYALVSLNRYQKAYEAEPTEMTARMWLGDGFLGEAQFDRRTMKIVDLEVPMRHVVKTGPADLILDKDGPGRLYYRVGMRYAPRDIDLPAREQGFAVERRYLAIDDPEDVQGDAARGWRVKAGATVRVEVELVVPDRRYYAVVDDPLPAGLELVNLGYATSAQEERLGQEGWSWSFQHRELRDDRALHFADRLPAGVYTLHYLARATTRGDFIVPPARAEEMYRPEVFGRTPTQRMSVE